MDLSGVVWVVLDFVVSFLKLSAVYYTGGCVLQLLVPQFVPVQRLHDRDRPTGQNLRDALRSLGPLAIKALVWTVVRQLHEHNIGQIYLTHDLTPYELLYWLWVVLVLDLVHDTWFYFTHRFLHWKPIYRHIHYFHHQSRVPSAFSGYSFHIVEAALVFANEILICFYLPIDLRLHRLYHLFSTLIHQGGHVGYEISPYSPMLSNLLLYLFLPSGVWQWLASYWMNTVRHHEMHHTYVSCHFSLYYTHWERLFHTLHSSYDEDPTLMEAKC